jgi:hypothetical protein
MLSWSFAPEPTPKGHEQMAAENNLNAPGAGGDSTKAKWEPMTLRELGQIGQVIQTGGGKFTFIGGDPGESRKQKPAAPTG